MDKTSETIKPFSERKWTLKMGIAIDPTYINIGRLERTEPNIIYFKWEVT